MINYIVDPSCIPNYKKIRETYEEIKATSSDDLTLDYIILVSSNRYSCKGYTEFIDSREKYIGKNIKLFLVREKEIIDIVGPITLIDHNMFFAITEWIFEFIGTDQYFNFYEIVNKYFINSNYPKDKIVYYE